MKSDLPGSGSVPPLARAVLLVDDEPQALKWFARSYGDEFDVRTAASVRQALELLDRQGHEVAVLLTDYRMPERDGVALLAEVRQVTDDQLQRPEPAIGLDVGDEDFKIVQQVHDIVERHLGKNKVISAAAFTHYAESGFTRRKLIRRSLYGALAVFPIPALVIFGDLGPQVGDTLKHTIWKKGVRLVRDSHEGGTPIKASSRQIPQNPHHT